MPDHAAPSDLAHRFTYHPPEPEQPEVYGLLRDAGYHLALLVQACTKPSREQSLAFTKVEEAVMHANAAIARHGLADPAYAGAADVHDLVLGQLLTERPTSPLVAADPDEHWHAEDQHDVPPAVLHAGLRAIAADAVAREDHHTAAYAHSVLAGEPIPPVTTDDDPLEDGTDPAAVHDLLDAAARWGQLGVLRVARRLFHADAWEAAHREDVPATEPQAPTEGETGDAPPYLALELALRHVRQQIGAGGTGTVGDLLDYIDRVLANDLTDPADA